jgi:hypothetical protein
MSDEFLARWSRLKGEARRGAAADPAPPPAADPAARESAADSVTADEIAALPKVEELTADSDVTAFLRHGVPASLRNAALRRMWLLDPAIRDFAGHARDYDYDWNTPGGAPGYGALRADEDVAAMVRRVMGVRADGERHPDTPAQAAKGDSTGEKVEEGPPDAAPST